MSPKRLLLTLGASTAALFLISACSSPESESTESTPTDAAMPAATADGATMGANETIVGTAIKAPNLSTLVAAVQAAGLVETLSGPGPFTVFAPDNAAFEKIPMATREALLSPAGKADLTKILTYHVVSGNVNAATLTQQIQAGGGSAALTTVQGGVLTARVGADGTVTLTDAMGGVSRVVQTDVASSNGVVHIIDTVVMP